MQKGKIGVSTENIFPIIKKFLYSDHEIFLRELISNAVDATQKIKTLAGASEFKGELGDLTIRVNVDKEKKTITISDAGVGMTQEEVEKYINQIAFSGAEEFVNKFKDQSVQIIGHFGLGFYSSFMVSKSVEVISKSWKDEPAVRWECDGSPEYQIEETTRATGRGTDIVLHVADDSEEFLEESRISALLNKYCKFMPIEIAFGKKKEWKDGKYENTEEDNIINQTNPIWTKKPTELKDEDYAEFYRTLYPMADEPMFHIHLNVDYPFNLTGILYFPKISNNIDLQKNKIQLYSNQVFVTDSVEGIVPEFLTLLHGVIDSPDIPLNVSRSYLQSDSNVKKISNHITKKVADRLNNLFKNERETYEQKWADLKLFVEYGMLTDEKFYESAQKFVMFKDVDGKHYTIEEYREAIKLEQTDKDNKVVHIYSNDPEAQYSFNEAAKAHGYNVLVMDGQLDNHFIQMMEGKLENVQFVRVDSDVVDNLVRKEQKKEWKLTTEEQENLKPVFEANTPEGEAHYNVSFEALSETAAPIIITQNEFMRRMKDMSQMGGGGGMNFYGKLPDSYTVVVNANHPLVVEVKDELKSELAGKIEEFKSQLQTEETALENLKKEKGDKKDEDVPADLKTKIADAEVKVESIRKEQADILGQWGKSHKAVRQLIDLALLSNNMLKGEALSNFVKRSLELIKK
ncbi:molecular chaperone HtpG [Alistipes sp. ZOR0009]|uniref:molecular chaperone HtpG n=1 Tax=Alistipes sp. ZOR0009 TaxID=1339253 RepID=UPI0006470C9E|nr:molecular chaperone HtpG [Alistipes sp. ZOR0009]